MPSTYNSSEVFLYTSQQRRIYKPRTLTFAKVKFTAADELVTVASLMAFAIGVGPQKYVWDHLKSATIDAKSLASKSNIHQR
jgi:hypothetical protein